MAMVQRFEELVAWQKARTMTRGRRKEFHQYLSTAKASCAEVRSLLYVAADVGYLGQPEFDALLSQSDEVSRVIGGLRAAVARQIPESKRRNTAAPTKGRNTQSSALSPQSSPSPA